MPDIYVDPFVVHKEVFRAALAITSTGTTDWMSVGDAEQVAVYLEASGTTIDINFRFQSCLDDPSVPGNWIEPLGLAMTAFKPGASGKFLVAPVTTVGIGKVVRLYLVGGATNSADVAAIITLIKQKKFPGLG